MSKIVSQNVLPEEEIHNFTFQHRNMLRTWILICLLSPIFSLAQLTSSNLPIVIISTEDSMQIFDEPKRTAEIGIIFNGQGEINRISDQHNEYSGKIGIEIRGESSQLFPKKSYLFETWDSLGNDIDTSFLNFPPEEDFILYAPFTDKSMLNNVLAMKIGNEMGRYASRTRYVELVLNGEYQGLYVLMEKIKRDKNRVDISNLRAEDIDGDELTGGYIFRIDKGIYQGWDSKYNVFDGNKKIFFQYFYPDQNNIRTEQKAYIQDFMDLFEDAIASPNYTNSAGKRYTDYINLRSFVDNFIINELSKNVDAYRLSSYFHKNKNSNGGKLVAGPLWDFNLSFGNADYCEGDNIIGWEYYQCTGNSPFWWDQMLKDDFFKDALRCRWEELRTNIIATDSLHAFIDSKTLELEDAIMRNYQKWPILGQYVWPNAWYFAQATSHEEIIGTMKARLKNRAEWLDLNIPGNTGNCDFYDNFDTEQMTNVPFIPDPENYHINIFPNPNQGILNIESESIILELSISDVIGQQLYRKDFDSNTISMSIEGFLKAGTYIISIRTEKGLTSETLFVF